MWVLSLGWEDPLEKGMATHSNILAWRIPMDRGAWWAMVRRVAKSQTQLHIGKLLSYRFWHANNRIAVCISFLLSVSLGWRGDVWVTPFSLPHKGDDNHSAVWLWPPRRWTPSHLCEVCTQANQAGSLEEAILLCNIMGTQRTSKDRQGRRE